MPEDISYLSIYPIELTAYYNLFHIKNNILWQYQIFRKDKDIKNEGN